MRGRSLDVNECMELIEEVRLLADHEEAEYCASQEDQGHLPCCLLYALIKPLVMMFNAIDFICFKSIYR